MAVAVKAVCHRRTLLCSWLPHCASSGLLARPAKAKLVACCFLKSTPGVSGSTQIQTKAGGQTSHLVCTTCVCWSEKKTGAYLVANNSALCCPGEKGKSASKSVEAADLFLGGICVPVCHNPAVFQCISCQTLTVLLGVSNSDDFTTTPCC